MLLVSIGASVASNVALKNHENLVNRKYLLVIKKIEQKADVLFFFF
jgi:hypothetical protein